MQEDDAFSLLTLEPFFTISTISHSKIILESVSFELLINVLLAIIITPVKLFLH